MCEETKKKDLWDKLNILLTLIIAGMVAFWGYKNEQRQHLYKTKFDEKIIELEQQRVELDKSNQEFKRIQTEFELELKKQAALNASVNKDEDQAMQKLAVIQTLIPHILDKSSSRKVALIMLSKLGEEKLSLEIAGEFDDEVANEAGDSINQNAVSEEQDKFPEPTVSQPIKDAVNLKTGWMYLGRRSNGKWYGNFVSIPNNKSVQDLSGEIVSVKQEVSGLNVRTNHPDFWGKVMPVEAILKPGSEVRIGNKYHYTFKSYIWVQVEYKVD